MDALGARRHFPGWLLLVALVAAPWTNGDSAQSGQAGAPSMVAASVAPDTDLLYLQPAGNLAPQPLADALATLGYAGAEAVHAGGVRVPGGDDPPALAHALAATGLVRSVEADGRVTAAREPDDPLFLPRQRAYLDAIRAPEAWQTATGDRRIVIAVIDTGVDWNHPDLATQIFINERQQALTQRDDDGSGCIDDVAGCNFVSLSTADPSCGYLQPPPNGRAFDDEGHGTFVAGVAAAAGNNGQGITGIAWAARILPVKVLDCTATGRISDAAAGIRYAATMGADIINISFGTPNDSPALREAVAFAQAQGAIVVASAGNDGRTGVTYPARYPGVLSVAASGLHQAGTIDYTTTAEFARFGAPVDFLAPGVDLVSTVPAAACEEQAGPWTCVDGAYAVASGSSFATPVVSGALAVLMAHHPERTSGFVASLLLGARAFRDGEPGGLVDLAAAVEQSVVSGGVPGTARTTSTGGSPSDEELRGPAGP